MKRFFFFLIERTEGLFCFILFRVTTQVRKGYTHMNVLRLNIRFVNANWVGYLKKKMLAIILVQTKVIFYDF